MCRTRSVTEIASGLSSKKSLSLVVAIQFVDQYRICLPVANNFHVKSRTHESLKSSDLDRWTNYLGGKGITTNPFGRSQLETNSYELKLAFGLSETGAKMKFSIAYQIRTQLVSSVTEHDQGGEQRDSKHHAQISVISSLPGGRKTRL